MAGVNKRSSLRRGLETAQGILVCGAMVFAPWAFACTVTPAIVAMTILGYAMGLLLAAKGLEAWRSGYQEVGVEGGRWPSRVLLALGVLVLVYAWTSAFNGRATMVLSADRQSSTLEYREALEWLPHSYDQPISLRACVRYVGLFFLFWGVRDWLMGSTRAERRSGGDLGGSGGAGNRLIPGRLRIFLWVFVVSSVLLAVVGLLHRFDGNSKILWLLPHRYTGMEHRLLLPEMWFGPFAYRGNAATYLNFAWPLCLGLAWTVRRESLMRDGFAHRAGSSPHPMLFLMAGILLFCAILTTSRGGVVIAGVEAGACVLILLAASGRSDRWMVGVGAVVLAAAAVGAFLVQKQVMLKRFSTVATDQMSGRERIYEVARRMGAEFQPFGSGPETFTSLYGMYRQEPNQIWEGFAHNDYLETWVTWGSIGMVLLLVTFVWAPCVAWMGRSRPLWWPVYAFLAVSLAGFMIHARFDFPFQVYSLVFIFLSGCAIISGFRPAPSQRPSEETPDPEFAD